jgi:hypothetical protein|tara:strand:- start:56 stop:469 length:414 start_codon:yes stop_codon:yes gene_type:complete
MQTFLPYPDMHDSVACLDNKRLGKQRVEAMQILNVLEGRRDGWKNHPAVKMWGGCTEALHLYKDLCIAEWIDRGFNNTMDYTSGYIWNPLFPEWWGGEIHATHRSNLLRKDAQHYGQFGWCETDDLPYFWPTKSGET